MAVLTSKGASGVTGAAFIALVATLMVIPTIPVAGMALLIGIDRFMSMARAVVNMIGNGVATVVVARWENELDKATLQKNLAKVTRLRCQNSRTAWRRRLAGDFGLHVVRKNCRRDAGATNCSTLFSLAPAR